MSKIRLCCLLDPINTKLGIMGLYDDKKYGVPTICKGCYDALLDEIPEGIRSVDSKGVWEAMIEFVHLRITQEHLNDS